MSGLVGGRLAWSKLYLSQESTYNNSKFSGTTPMISLLKSRRIQIHQGIQIHHRVRAPRPAQLSIAHPGFRPCGGICKTAYGAT